MSSQAFSVRAANYDHRFVKALEISAVKEYPTIPIGLRASTRCADDQLALDEYTSNSAARGKYATPIWVT